LSEKLSKKFIYLSNRLFLECAFFSFRRSPCEYKPRRRPVLPHSEGDPFSDPPTSYWTAISTGAPPAWDDSETFVVMFATAFNQDPLFAIQRRLCGIIRREYKRRCFGPSPFDAEIVARKNLCHRFSQHKLIPLFLIPQTPISGEGFAE